MPIDSSGDFAGTFWNLFTGYTVLGGIAFVLLFAFHGAIFLTLRTRRRPAASGREHARAGWRSLGGRARRCFLIWTVVVAVDRNDKSVFPPVLPAAIAIAALVARRRLRLRPRRSVWAFTMTGLGDDRGRRHALHAASTRA